MAKIFVEVAKEFKEKFILECAKRRVTQRSVITHLIEMWFKRKVKK